MREVRCARGIWALCLGMWLVAIAFATVIWSVYKTCDTAVLMALCVGGFSFWLIERVLIGRNKPAKRQRKEELPEDPREFCFEGFYLNGHFFQPYEQLISTEQKKFRLLSRPPMEPEREAAVIRYLINEGLSERMWPLISRRIEEEASWTFSA